MTAHRPSPPGRGAKRHEPDQLSRPAFRHGDSPSGDTASPRPAAPVDRRPCRAYHCHPEGEGHETVAQVGRIKVDPLDEMLFLSHLEQLAFERSAEIEGLSCKTYPSRSYDDRI